MKGTSMNWLDADNRLIRFSECGEGDTTNIDIENAKRLDNTVNGMPFMQVEKGDTRMSVWNAPGRYFVLATVDLEYEEHTAVLAGVQVLQKQA